MNAQLYSFCLFVLWTGVTVTALAFGPALFPKEFGDGGQFKFVGIGAGMLALWNLAKWWSLRQRLTQSEYRRHLEVTYRQKRLVSAEEKEKQVVNPELQFEESRPRIPPPPPPPNGTQHGAG